MADKSIRELTEATQITNTDLFVLQQNNIACKMTGQTMISELTRIADGHGGISSISEPTVSGLNKTYTINFADGTTSSFTVTDGMGISTAIINNNSQLVITYTNGTTYTSASLKGNTGAVFTPHLNTSGDLSWTNNGGLSNPSTVNVKGDKGDTGDAANVVVTTQYCLSDTAEIPASGWQNTRPTPVERKYYWTRTHYNWNNGATAYYEYTVGYIGSNGSGSGTVTSVNGVSDVNGNVTLTANDVGSIADPANKSNGQALVWDESASAWIASTITQDGVVTKVNNKNPDANGAVTIYGGNIATSATDSTSLTTALQNKQNRAVTTTDTIGVQEWSNNKCTKTIVGITANSKIICSPTPESFIAYGAAQIRATAQNANTIEFTCETVPTEAVSFNLLLL